MRSSAGGRHPFLPLLLATPLALALPGGGALRAGVVARSAASLAALYRRTAPAVVGLTCRTATDPYFGTGTVIDPQGLILTSVSVVPPGAFAIRVFFTDGREGGAELLKVEPRVEASLLRLTSLAGLLEPGAAGLAYLPFGDSRRLQVGDPACTFGNAFHSIETDGNAVMGAGIVSGLYALEELRPQATYLGPAIETTAALNDGMDGGPLVDAGGRLVGLLSLNYSTSRWLGPAVPVHVLKPALVPYRGWFDDSESPGHAFAGVELERLQGEPIRIARVAPRSPAARCGLKEGDRLAGFRGREVESLDAFRDLFAAARAGERVEWRVERGGETLRLSCRLWGRF